MPDSLLPCPFCGAGTTLIKENGRIWTGQKYGEPSSVSVQHWCDPVEGQPSRMVERVGRDHASAIAAWNRRALPAPTQSAVSAIPSHRELMQQALDAINAELSDEWECNSYHPELHAAREALFAVLSATLEKS